MAWPSTKATTTHLDAQTDDPNQARPQIKQNIDNVNAIIDYFPSGVIDIGNQTVVLEMSGTGAGTGSDYNEVAEHSDAGSNCTITSNDRFTLTSGTYIMEHEITINEQGGSNPGTASSFKNDTSGATIVTALPVEIGTNNQCIQMGLNNTVFSSNGTDKFGFLYPTYTPSNSANPRDGLRIKFTKIA
tara:strand:+ start:409 stop:969 length:561 start_codon:yes stop_codon:yes gene_type:complete